MKMNGYLLTLYSASVAMAQSTTVAAGDIEDVSTVEVDNPELYIAVRSFVAVLAEEAKTLSGLESIYAEATAAVAQITDNEAAKFYLTATDPSATA